MYSARSAWAQIRHRAPWLAVNVAGGLGCAWLLGIFQMTVAQALFVTFFIPVVLVLAEGIGMQSTAVAAIRAQQFPARALRWRQFLLREGAVAVGMGILCAMSVSGLAYFWLRHAWFAWALGLAITLSMGCAAVLGTCLPLLFHRWKIDPSIASGPLVLAFSDNLILLIYMGLIRFPMAVGT